MNGGGGVVVGEIFLEKGLAGDVVGETGEVVAEELFGGEFGEVCDGRHPPASAKRVDDFFADEGADACVGVGIGGDGVADVGVEADEGDAGGDFDFAEDFTGAAEDVGESSGCSAGDGDLVHDAAGSADDAVFGELSELCEAERGEVEVEVGVEGGEGGEFDGGGFTVG